MEDMVVGAASPVDQHVAGSFPKNPSANRDAGFRGRQHVRPGRTDPPNRSPQRHLAAMTRQVRHLVRPPAGRAQRRVGDRRRLRDRRRRKSTKSLLRFPACPTRALSARSALQGEPAVARKCRGQRTPTWQFSYPAARRSPRPTHGGHFAAASWATVRGDSANVERDLGGRAEPFTADGRKDRSSAVDTVLPTMKSRFSLTWHAVDSGIVR